MPADERKNIGPSDPMLALRKAKSLIAGAGPKVPADFWERKLREVNPEDYKLGMMPTPGMMFPWYDTIPFGGQRFKDYADLMKGLNDLREQTFQLGMSKAGGMY